ncbi:hypothetical protein KDA00_00630 [Candidatus Saccharibacteria bacterium]|nr:hypothetical protein [Candidatus Saccharibacteria bacterium]
MSEVSREKFVGKVELVTGMASYTLGALAGLTTIIYEGSKQIYAGMHSMSMMRVNSGVEFDSRSTTALAVSLGVMAVGCYNSNRGFQRIVAAEIEEMTSGQLPD